MPKHRNFHKASNKHNLKAEKAHNNHHNSHESNSHQKFDGFNFETHSVMKCDNPKALFFLSLMISASMIGGYYYINQNPILKASDDKKILADIVDKSSSKPRSDLSSSNVWSACKTAIFYEAHQDSRPVKFVNELLPYFAEHNYTTFLFEEPKGMTLTENIERLSATQQRIKTSYPLNPFLGIFEDSIRETLNLLTNIKDHKLTYIAVDMDANSRARANINDPADLYQTKARDQIMAESIHSACKLYKTNQVFIVGAMHGKIASKLKELGHKVVSSYIIDHETLYDPSLESIGRANNDYMLRSNNTEYMKTYGYEGMRVINYYDNYDDIETSISGLIEELSV